MKKVILFASLLTCGLISTAHAQDKTSFGIKLNGNLTNVKLTEGQGSDTKFNPGASVSGFARIRITETLSLQPELAIGYTEAKVKTELSKQKFKYLNVQIPVFLLAGINAGSGKVLLGIGPHIGYGLSADTRVEKLPEGHPGENKIELDHWYSGAGITAGYEFRNRISVNAGYQMGFDFTSSHNSSQVKTQTISLAAAYRF